MRIGRKVRTLTSLAGVIDLHCHLLPGIDDGAPDLDTSLAMARVAIAGGVEEIVATPHVSGHFRNDPETFADRVAELQDALDAAALPLRVRTGAELAHSIFSELSDDALRAAALGGGNYLLVEPPYAGPAPFIGRLVEDLQQAGFGVLLAHPERIGAFQRNIGLLESLVDAGCLCSVTAGSLTGQFGGAVKRFTQELFARALVHNLASDAHDAEYRSPALRPQLDQAVAELPELRSSLGWLTVEVPRAILTGATPAGEPPRIQPKRGLLGRLRGR
jgi:protein-tyrosine phosphatase